MGSRTRQAHSSPLGKRMTRYNAPKLDGQKVAYKGKRFWVIEIEENQKFEWVDRDLGEYAVYDKALEAVIAIAWRNASGGFKMTVPWGPITHEVHVGIIKAMGIEADREGHRMYKAYG